MALTTVSTQNSRHLFVCPPVRSKNHLRLVQAPERRTAPQAAPSKEKSRRVINLEDERGSGRFANRHCPSLADRAFYDDERGSGRVRMDEPATLRRRNAMDDDERGSGRFNAEKSKTERFTVVEPLEPRRRRVQAPNTSQQSLPFRLIAIGSRQAILDNIKQLHHLGYAEAIAWSALQKGFGEDEFMSVLTLVGTRISRQRVEN